jgi:aspartate/methionine/tyrosine aminotransferase
MLRSFDYTSPAVPRSSPTMTAANLAAKARALGIAVDVFTIGDLFPKPAEAEIQGWVQQLRAAAVAAPKEPRFQLRPAARERAYSETGGLPSLREQIALSFVADTGQPATAADVRCGNGGKGALTGAFAYLAGVKNPTILMAAPGWPTNYDMFPAGTRIVEIDTNGRGLMTPEELAAALQQLPNPSVILINAPSNPTGANYSPAEREALLQVVADTTTMTIVAFDDPYGKLVFDREPYDIRSVLERGATEKKLFAGGRIAVFRTASKEYGMAGSRVGWLVTKNTELLTSLQNYNESKGGGVSSGSQLEVQAALMFGDDFIAATVATLKAKRALVMDGIGKLRHARMAAPQATIYAWIDFSALRGRFVPLLAIPTEAARQSNDVLNDAERKAGGFTLATPDDLMRYLVFVTGFCPVSGTPFYAPGSPAGKADWHVRMSFCNDEAELKRGLASLARAEAQLLEAPTRAA